MSDFDCSTCVWSAELAKATRHCRYTPPEIVFAGDSILHSAKRFVADDFWCSRWQGGSRETIMRARMANSETNIAVAGRDDHDMAMRDMREQLTDLVERIVELRGEQAR